MRSSTQEPFLLDGGRAGMEMCPPSRTNVAREAAPPLLCAADADSLHLQPNPSSIEEEGLKKRVSLS
jgi:hypothetical protein